MDSRVDCDFSPQGYLRVSRPRKSKPGRCNPDRRRMKSRRSALGDAVIGSQLYSSLRRTEYEVRVLAKSLGDRSWQVSWEWLDLLRMLLGIRTYRLVYSLFHRNSCSKVYKYDILECSLRMGLFRLILSFPLSCVL